MVKNSATLTSRHIFSKLFTRSIGSIHYWGPKPCKWWGLRVYKVGWKSAKGHTSTSSAFSLALEKHKVSEMRDLPLLLMDGKIKEAFKETSGYRGFRILWLFTEKYGNGQLFEGIQCSDWGVSTLVLGPSEKKWTSFAYETEASVKGSLWRRWPWKTFKAPVHAVC